MHLEQKKAIERMRLQRKGSAVRTNASRQIVRPGKAHAKSKNRLTNQQAFAAFGMSFAKVGHAIGKVALLREESDLAVRQLSTQLTICIAAKAITIGFAAYAATKRLPIFIDKADWCLIHCRTEVMGPQ